MVTFYVSNRTQVVWLIQCLRFTSMNNLWHTPGIKVYGG